MKRFVLLVVLPLVVVVAGVGSWGTRQPAVAETHDRSVALFNAMETYAGSTALDQAMEAASYPGVDVVVARNLDDGGHDIVLKITAEADRRTNLDWWPDQGASYEAARCYRWTEDREWDTADEVDCPQETDIDPARAPRPGPLGPNVERRVRQALSRSTTAAEVSAALDGLDEASVASVDGAIAVAVSHLEGFDNGMPVRDCVLGFRRDGTVRVWRPSAIQVAPGESTCDPAGALDPVLQSPPH